MFSNTLLCCINLRESRTARAMFLEALSLTEMCGKKVCETLKKLACPTLNVKDDEKPKEAWWTKSFILQPSTQEMPQRKQRFLQEGCVWIRDLSVLSDWEKRYFVLCAEKLYYINKNTSPPAFAGAISIADMTSLISDNFPSEDGKVGHCVRVYTKCNNFVLYWRSEERRNTWLTALLCAKAIDLLEEKSDANHDNTNEATLWVRGGGGGGESDGSH